MPIKWSAIKDGDVIDSIKFKIVDIEIPSYVTRYGISKTHTDREAKIAELKRNGFVIVGEDSNGFMVFERHKDKLVSADWLG